MVGDNSLNDVTITGIGMTSQRTRDRLIQRLRDEGIQDERVLTVMRNIPRHLFVDEALSHRAYEDTALPIGHYQTISQPYIVARMTEILLAGGPLKKVLEVGTGSGYQTAILSQLVDQLFTTERIEPLLDQAQQLLRSLKIRGVRFKHSDGGMGWPIKAPFDGIIATCAPRQVPEELLEQLAPGGRMVIPVGEDDHQELLLITREGNEFTRQVMERVRFVPLIRGSLQ